MQILKFIKFHLQNLLVLNNENNFRDSLTRIMELFPAPFRVTWPTFVPFPL